MKIRKWFGRVFWHAVVGSSEDAGSKEKLGQPVAGRFRDRQMLPGFKLLRPANYPFSAAQINMAKFLTNL
jgi:hypothetical protein